MCSCPLFFRCRPFSPWYFSFFHRRYKIFMFFFQQNWSLLFFITFSNFSLFSTSMKTLKLSPKKELALLLFISKSPGGYAIYYRNAQVLEMQNFTPAYMKGTRTYGVTDDFLKPGFHQRISISKSISTSTCVSKSKLGRHKHKHKHKKNGQVRSSCACAYAYVVALTSENWVDISTSISTRPWTNHRSLWPRPHANISKAIWRMLRPPSCLSLGWGELVSRIESNMPF